MSANGRTADPAPMGLLLPPDPPPTDYGEHEGHNVHPHDHRLHSDRVPFCTGRFFCTTCRTDKTRGTWFWGPECQKSKSAAKKSEVAG